jgi:hypothetical protein
MVVNRVRGEISDIGFLMEDKTNGMSKMKRESGPTRDELGVNGRSMILR